MRMFDQWAVDREPVLTLITLAKVGKTAIGRPTSVVHDGDRLQWLGVATKIQLKGPRRVVRTR